MGKGVDSVDDVHVQKMGLQLEPEYQHVDLEFALDCKRAKVDENLELWLLQVPVDFPLEEKTSWQRKEGSGGAPVLTCQADGLEYCMEEDNSLGTSAVYAVDGDIKAATQVDRRLTIYRTTVAPKLCFGLDASEIAPIVEEQAPIRAPKAGGRHKAPVAVAAADLNPASTEGAKDSKKKKKREGEREDKEDKKKKKKKKEK